MKFRLRPRSGRKLRTLPPVSVGSMVLLTDGRVLVHSEPNCSGCTGNYQNWYTLTPDNTGSYINGTWTKVASLPASYAPLFFGSAVLPDGKVVVQAANTIASPIALRASGSLWVRSMILSPTPGPPRHRRAGTTNLGDAQSVVLPNGTWLLAECCAIAFGDSRFPALLQLQRGHADLHRSSQLHRWQER